MTQIFLKGTKAFSQVVIFIMIKQATNRIQYVHTCDKGSVSNVKFVIYQRFVKLVKVTANRALKLTV